MSSCCIDGAPYRPAGVLPIDAGTAGEWINGAGVPLAADGDDAAAGEGVEL